MMHPSVPFRALPSLHCASLAEVAHDVDAALSGVAEYPLAAEVVALARRVNPAVLRSLDALHLASVPLVDAAVVRTYGQRLAAACVAGGLAVAAPGHDAVPPAVPTPRQLDTTDPA